MKCRTGVLGQNAQKHVEVGNRHGHVPLKFNPLMAVRFVKAGPKLGNVTSKYVVLMDRLVNGRHGKIPRNVNPNVHMIVARLDTYPMEPIADQVALQIRDGVVHMITGLHVVDVSHDIQKPVRVPNPKDEREMLLLSQ